MLRMIRLFAAVSLLMCCLLEGISGYSSWPVNRSQLQGPTKNGRVSIAPLYDIPLELSGRLDASRSWDVKFVFNGQEKIVSVPEDKSMLEMGESIFDGVDSSCRNGVCTTCAGQVKCCSDMLRYELILASSIDHMSSHTTIILQGNRGQGQCSASGARPR